MGSTHSIIMSKLFVLAMLLGLASGTAMVANTTDNSTDADADADCETLMGSYFAEMLAFTMASLTDADVCCPPTSDDGSDLCNAYEELTTECTLADFATDEAADEAADDVEDAADAADITICTSDCEAGCVCDPTALVCGMTIRASASSYSVVMALVASVAAMLM